MCESPPPPKRGCLAPSERGLVCVWFLSERRRARPPRLVCWHADTLCTFWCAVAAARSAVGVGCAQGQAEKRKAQEERNEFRRQFGDVVGGAGSEDKALDELDLTSGDVADLVERDDETGTLIFKAPDMRSQLRKKVRQIEAESPLVDVRFPQDQLYEREERFQERNATSPISGAPKTAAEKMADEARRVGLIGDSRPGKKKGKAVVDQEAEKYLHMWGMDLDHLDAYDNSELEALTAGVLKAARADNVPLSEEELAELERLEADAELAAEEEANMALEAENAAPGTVIEEDAYEVAAREAREVALEFAKICDDTKARDLEVINVGEEVYWCNYWVVLSVTSRPQMNAVAERCRKRGIELGRTLEGGRGETRQNAWTLLDFGDVVVHVFTPAAREYYDIEGRYPEAKRVPLPFLDPLASV